jgi:hypothetical protein
MPELDDDETSPLTQEFQVPLLPPLPNVPPVAAIDTAGHISTKNTNESAFSYTESAPVNAYETDVAGQSSQTSLLLDNEIAKAQYFTGKIKFKNEGVRATKDLFLTDPSSRHDIPANFFINGVINTTPYRGSQEYRIVWETTSLPFPLEDSSLRTTIVKTDLNRMALLQMSRFNFDSVYPLGPKGVVNVVAPSVGTNQAQMRKKWSTVSISGGATPQEKRQSRQRQQVANIRMNPVCAILDSNLGNNQPLRQTAFGTAVEHVESEDEEDGMNGESKEISDEVMEFPQLTDDDILHGYTADEQYNTENMEEDGEYSEPLDWEYVDVPNDQEDVAYPHYNGNGPALRPYVSRRFTTLLGACGVAGGFSYELMKRITANTNAYVRSKQ